MLDKQKLQEVVEAALADSPIFLVGIKISADNVVEVTVDSPEGIDIETCVAITRQVEQAFDRDVEDYELQVGSAGLTAPFTVPEQYFMNVGNDVTVLTADGRKLHGILAEVKNDMSEVTIEVPTKVKEPGAKRPVLKNIPTVLAPGQIKSIVREIKF